jgi:formylglycine-generating enzyme required for sulfatase activity
MTRKKKSNFLVYLFIVIVFVLSLPYGCKETDDDPVFTKLAPVITTSDINNIILTTAVSGGNITHDGGSMVTSRGVCWSTGQTPTIADSYTTDGDGKGIFTSIITGLTPNVKYYLRAYAINGEDTSYGGTMSFTPKILSVEIPAGTFTMGSPLNEVDRLENETQHQVTLSAFRMGKYEITNAEYAEFLNAKKIGSDGKYAKGKYPTYELIYGGFSIGDIGLHYTNSQWIPVAGYEYKPVKNVTWFGADEFATFVGGRLPTESEWEYACRGNTTTEFNTGTCLSNEQANYQWEFPISTCTNTKTVYPGKTLAVGLFPANGFDLNDMHGNVSEWCSDWYGPYPTTPQTNPKGAATGIRRVHRGGCWYDDARYCRSALRYFIIPSEIRGDANGFRIVQIH